MGIAGESVSQRVLEFKQFTPDKILPTVSLAEASTPELVTANQEKIRDAHWQIICEETVDRMKRDLEYDLNTLEPGSISHGSLKSEFFVEKGAVWFPYLNPEQKKDLEKFEVKLTAREVSEGLSLEEKKTERLKRKASLLIGERKINWQRGIDKSIWKRLNNRFFLESKGITYADIDEELSKGFLETFDKGEEMYNFLLGVGWNQALVDIFDNRRRHVEELREILSQRKFGKHFEELKKDEDKMNEIKYMLGWGDDAVEKFGDTRNLMKSLRIAQGVENNGGLQQKSLGLINEELMSRSTTTALDTLNGFSSEQQNQLNNRAMILFGDEFLNLSNEEQLMTVTGPGTILSLEEIMDFLSDYEVSMPNNNDLVTKIRPESADREYAYWIRYGWVSMIGPWRLADRINKMIFNYSARDDQRALQKQQVESAGMSGFGKYTYFDWDYYEAFNGAGGEGKRKALLEGTINKVEWPKGFWAEYKSSQEKAYYKYKAEAEKVNKVLEKTGEKEKMKKIVTLDEFSNEKSGVGDYKKIAKEWFLSGWRLVAEGVYLKLRGEAVEQAARRGVDAKQIDETLDQDVMGQKITHAGKEVLVKRYLEAKRTVFLDIAELFRAWGDKTGHKASRFTAALKDLVLDKFLIDFMFKEIQAAGFKFTPASLVGFLTLGIQTISAFMSSSPVVVGAFQLGKFAFEGFKLAGGGLGAAWPWALGWFAFAGGIALVKDRLYLRKEVGEKKWAETEKKMNEKFIALAENPTRALIESGWDPEKASVDSHEPIKII